MDLDRIKCGRIFILSTDYFSLICEFCAGDFFTLEDLHEHMQVHEHALFPESPITIIEIEDSSDSDSESVTLEKRDDQKDNGFGSIALDLHYGPTSNLIDDDHLPEIKIEETNSDCESIPPEMQDYMMDFKDVVKYEVGSESFSVGISSKFNSNQYNDKIIQSEQIEGKTPKHEIHQSNNNNNECTSSEPKAKEITHSNRYPKRLRKGITVSIPQPIYINENSETDDNDSNYSRELKKIEKPFCSLPKKDIKPTRTRRIGKVEFQCSFCSKKMNGRRDRDEHENTHTGNRPYICRICSRTFASSSNLRGHLKWHENNRKYKCSMCERAFVRSRRLNDHIRENHLPDSDPRRYFPCQLCDAKLKSACKLQTHKQTHRKHCEYFVCDCCQKQFNTKRKVVEHMVVHSRQKPFHCKHCNKKYAFHSEKYKHQRMCLSKLLE